MAEPSMNAPEKPRKETSGSNLVIVDLGGPQPPMAVKQLHKGKGPLLKNIEQVMKDLVEDGTIAATAQPVVIVVSQFPTPPWMMDDDD